MHRHQRPATSRVWLGSLIVSVALSLMVVLVPPAQAATGGDGRAVVKASASAPMPSRIIVYRTSIPKWVSRSTVRRQGRPKPTPMASVDWQWLKAGWEIKFNWAETRQMARGFSYCTAIAALLPTGVSQGVAAACGILWVLADVAKGKGKCIKVFLPLSLINPTISTWSCPH